MIWNLFLRVILLVKKMWVKWIRGLTFICGMRILRPERKSNPMSDRVLLTFRLVNLVRSSRWPSLGLVMYYWGGLNKKEIHNTDNTIVLKRYLNDPFFYIFFVWQEWPTTHQNKMIDIYIYDHHHFLCILQFKTTKENWQQTQFEM